MPGGRCTSIRSRVRVAWDAHVAVLHCGIPIEIHRISLWVYPMEGYWMLPGLACLYSDWTTTQHVDPSLAVRGGS